MKKDFVVVCISHQMIPEAFLQELPTKLTSYAPVKQVKFNLTLDNDQYELLNNTLQDLSRLYQVDVALIPKDIFEAKKGLVVFDMDSTLIVQEVIVEMAKVAGVGDQVKLITVRAMNGEMGFDESLSQRLSLMKGFNRNQMEGILKNLTFTPGVPEFVAALRSMGIKTAIASGGFEYFARDIQKQLQMDYVFANNLEFDGDILTGKIVGPIVNAEAKEQIIMELARKEGLSLDQVVAIGDGANDIPMLLKAGLGIAIHAKEKVQRTARYRINFGPMTHALGFMNHEAL
jgi:phosphoserine phosphatase